MEFLTIHSTKNDGESKLMMLRMNSRIRRRNRKKHSERQVKYHLRRN
jgi:hypothetical protein